MNLGLQWYALRVRPRYECRIFSTLQAKGYESLLPLCKRRRRWADRLKEDEIPLFDGYVFCRMDVEQRLLPILTTPGVIGIAGAGKIPIPVTEEELKTIQIIARSGLQTSPAQFLKVGAKVVLEHGPLAGIAGIVVSDDGQYRLIVSVELLQRSVQVEVERDWITPLQPVILPGLGVCPSVSSHNTIA